MRATANLFSLFCRQGPLTLLVILQLFIGVVLTGCVDECKDQYCLNGGDCLKGDCICPNGFTGTHCEYVLGGGGGGGINSGTLMFWSNQNGDIINVSLNGGYSGTVSSYYSTSQSNPPACGSSGCFNVALAYGSYSYSASDGTHNWSGTATVGASCNTILLYW